MVVAGGGVKVLMVLRASLAGIFNHAKVEAVWECKKSN